jgi:glutamate-1-semialdehyde 2,1-aminomutase
MKATSEEYFKRAIKVSPGGVHSPVRAFKSVEGTPVFFESAQGAYLTSVDGQSYVDFCQSFGPLILGHRDPEVSDAVMEMVDKAWSFGACEPYSLELAEWIVAELPWVQKIRFVSSGTEAVMSALRVARAATGRSKILKFEGCYHGHADSLLVKAGSGLAGESASDSAGITPQQASDTLTVPLDDEEALRRVFEVHGDKIAAIIFEPLPANYGLLVQRKEFIANAVAMARQRGVLVIFDEVISGFRVSMGGMTEVLDIKPDLVTYGKVIGGGFPVGAYGGRGDLMDLVAPQGPVYQAGTLSANPIGMRAGLATLKKVKRDKVHLVLEKNASWFCGEMARLIQKAGLPLQVTRYSSLFWIHHQTEKPIRAISQIPPTQKKVFNGFFHAALENGIYLPPSAFEVGFLSLAHTQSVLEGALKKFERVFAEVK